MSIVLLANGEPARFYREYIERVVRRHDISDRVARSRRWRSWMGGRIEDLREFYGRQSRIRPDWRIDVQETVEVGEWIAVRAFAGGIEAHNEDGSPQSPPFPTSVEWLSIVRVVDRRIAEIRLASWVDHSHS